jgi:hypothetical protein
MGEGEHAAPAWAGHGSSGPVGRGDRVAPAWAPPRGHATRARQARPRSGTLVARGAAERAAPGTPGAHSRADRAVPALARDGVEGEVQEVSSSAAPGQVLQDERGQREGSTARSASFNKRLQATAYSVRSCVAPAFSGA